MFGRVYRGDSSCSALTPTLSRFAGEGGHIPSSSALTPTLSRFAGEGEHTPTLSRFVGEGEHYARST